LNVVKTHYGNVLGYTPACFTQSLNGANRGNIVERKQSREWLARGEKSLRNLIPEFGRRRFAHKLVNQLIFDLDAKFRSGLAYGVPTHSSIGAEFLPLDEGHLPVPELPKVFERKHCGACMVEDDVCYAGYIPVARNRYKRDLHTLGKGSIHSYQAFHGPLLQQERVFFNQITAMTVADHEIEIALL
jgi:hypothetical protein